MEFERDTTWLVKGDASDTLYQSYYNTRIAGNLGKMCAISRSYANEDYATLSQENTAIVCNCPRESNIKQVNDIFLSMWANDGYSFDATTDQFLQNLACSEAHDNGPGVYAARALLGEFIICTNGFEKTTPIVDENASVEGSALVQDVTISVYPNPTEGEAYLFYEIGDRQTAVVNVYDLTGKLIAVTSLTSNTGVVTLNLSDLDSGVYLFQVLSEGQLLSTGRIIRN